MYTWLENLLGSVGGKKKTFAEKYWKPFGRYIRLNNREIEGADNGYWSRSREEHAFGQFSYAVVQANASMEDFSQVEVGLNGTFAGVYDGHGGHEAAWFVLQNLFTNLIHYAQGQGGSITESVFRNAFSKTEGQFIDFADLAKYRERNLYGVGSCCLTVLIWNKTLFVCHLGDSRAVLGRANKRKPSQIIAEQLSRDHNVNLPDVRREVEIEHEDDPTVVRQDENNVWRIKGIIQISRAIGDLYLKDAKYSAGHTRERITKPVISTDPEYHIRAIEPTDMFVILASDGLWEHLDNQEAVDIVAKGPRADIAKKLIKAAMKIAARKQRRSYRSVRKLATGARRPVHDDISVIVLFIDQDLLERSALVEEVSWQAFFSDGKVPSEFRNILGGASSSGGSGGAGPSGGGDGAGPSGYGGGGDGAGPSGYGGGGGGDGAGPSGYSGGGGVSTSGGGGGGGVNTSGPSDGSSTSSSDGENSSGGGEITEAGNARGKAVMEG